MTDLQQAAEIYWKVLDDQYISREEYIFSLRLVFGDHKGSPFHTLEKDLPQKTARMLMRRQPKFREMAEQWRPIFSSESTISEDMAKHFIVSIYNALEEVDDVFKQRIAPGVTRNTRGLVNDFITRRPNVKLGWAVQLTTLGSGRYNCVRNQLITGPGDLILLSPDALYDYRRDSSCDTWEHQWVYFFLEDNWLDLLQWPEIGPNIYHLSSSGKDFQKIMEVFDELNTVHLEDSKFSHKLIKNLFEQFLIRCLKLVPEKSTAPTDKRIIQAKDYITRNYNKPFSVDELASEIGLSSSRLTALFKKQTGTTVVRWRDEQRMTRAYQLLTQSDMPVNHLAEVVGYTDALYFSRCFHQYSGLSPSEYRAKKRFHLESKNNI
jgi:AraC family transcriptional regulator, arabinose operon regulatory protein